MKTDRTSQGTLFPGISGRDAVARFDAAAVTSSAGVLLVERTDRRLGLLPRYAACFDDHRDPRRVEHTVEQMVRQRVYGRSLGFEDITDHNHIGKDPLLVAACAKEIRRTVKIVTVRGSSAEATQRLPIRPCSGN